MEIDCVCRLCGEGYGELPTVQIGRKGMTGLSNAARLRGAFATVEGITIGSRVHKHCRVKFINQKDIDSCNRNSSHADDTPRPETRKRSLYDNKTDCLFCGQCVTERELNDASCVSTETFVSRINHECEKRNDGWAIAILGRINYCSGQLHAYDVVYHHDCDINFRTGKSIPVARCSSNGTKRQQNRGGRPINDEQAAAFDEVCTFLENLEDGQTSIAVMVAKMEALLPEGAQAYSKIHMSRRLKEKYGPNVRFSSDCGRETIVSFGDTMDTILRKFNEASKNKPSADEMRKMILESASMFILADIRQVATDAEVFPSNDDITPEKAVEFLPSSLRLLLKSVITQKDSDPKIGAIGQMIMQCARPRTIMAPVPFALALQLHYVFRSRFLVDHLNSLGLCCSYNEVTRFERNAASKCLSSPIGTIDAEHMVVFAGDNVDSNTRTIDGKGTFHGLGMIAAVTRRSSAGHDADNANTRARVVRKLTNGDMSTAAIPIHEYSLVGKLKASIRFDKLRDCNYDRGHVDILWESSCKFRCDAPSWAGMMCNIHSREKHHGKAEFFFLPMIDLQATDMTCLYSALTFVCDLAHRNRFTPVVTFDQPLYWKCNEIKYALTGSDPVKSTVIVLGPFHLQMNFLGAVGELMSGMGICDMFGTVYAPNAVTHMMTGKAVQRAFRAHLLSEKALTAELLEPLLECEEMKALIMEIEDSYHAINGKTLSLDDFLSKDCLSQLSEKIEKLKTDISVSRTCSMWVKYLGLVRLARDLVRADRTGDWSLHLTTITECLPVFAATGHFNYLKSAYLYVSEMNNLVNTHPQVAADFKDGLFVVRRTDKFWAGLGMDLSIEQVLMRALKTRGGLTHGSGLTEEMRNIWTCSAPVCSEVNLLMQSFTGQSLTTSCQHKDNAPSRMKRDTADFRKMNDYLKQLDIFNVEKKELRNVVNGIIASSNVNIDDYHSVGQQCIDKMIERDVFSISFSRKSKCVNMSAMKSVKVDDGISIDPCLLFQRLLIIAQMGDDLSLEDITKYELSPYPPALFASMNLPLKADKPPLGTAILEYVNSASPTASDAEVAETDHYVIDGGSLLHRVPWEKGASYDDVAKSYAKFVSRRHFRPTVIFDGYAAGPSIKDPTHRRRNSVPKPAIRVTESTKFVGKKEDILGNESNKNQIIGLIIPHLRAEMCHVTQSPDDADYDIASSAIKSARAKSTTVVGEDTDLLILLLSQFDPSVHQEVYFRSEKKRCTKVFDIGMIYGRLGADMCQSLPFLHAITGCDSTSRIAGLGKQGAFKKLVKSSRLQAIGKSFGVQDQSHEVIVKNGTEGVLILLNAQSNETSIDQLRYRSMKSKILKSNSFVKPDDLPPTSAALKYHLYRTYFQVMAWKGVHMDPCEWGWRETSGELIPITMDQAAAPQNLITIIRCKCKSGCETKRCGCLKYGLPCTLACGDCQNSNCSNNHAAELGDQEEEESL